MLLTPIKLFAGLILLLLASCASDPEEKTLFRQLDPNESGIEFNNALEENDTLNILDYEYIYNGGGVGIGDLDNDGLPEVYLTGNQEGSKLFKNHGGLKFSNITSASKTGLPGWDTGVAMVDVNGDGLLDLYVSVSGPAGGMKRANKLYLNKGNLQFEEVAKIAGVADTGYSTQAAFLDYDLDGDLDLYVLNATNDNWQANVPRPKIVDGSDSSSDQLYRNDGISSDGVPHFTNISKEAGVLIEGFGLGVAVNDLNLDRYPDLYISNDYISNDILYINQGDGTFQNEIGQYLKHQSHFGMGNDVADLTGDGKEDILVVDMLPPGNYRRKTMSGALNYHAYHLTLRRGYEPQFMRNTLQQNRGTGPQGYPEFSEVGQLAGLHQTDWSWAPLVADFDLDGRRDVFISNGFRRNVTDKDFVSYRETAAQGSSRAEFKNILLSEIWKLEGIKVHDYLFKNEGDLQFSDQSVAWGLGLPSYSNGAAYGDLEGDGDLDLIINRLDMQAGIYESRATEMFPDRHALRLSLQGKGANSAALGARIEAFPQDGKILTFYVSPFRGFQSSMDPVVHLGLGENEMMDSIRFTWPDGKVSQLENVNVDTLLTVRWEDASLVKSGTGLPAKAMLQPLTGNQLSDFKHQENDFNDYEYEPLLPRQYSREGPCIAGGDLNGDGLEDLVVGGASNQPTTIFIQKSDGSYQQKHLSGQEKNEDTGIAVFDADLDGDQDVYVASGGSEFPAGSPFYQDRLYVNDGRGNLSLSEGTLPIAMLSSSCVRPADMDGDGDIDLFVGGRIYPGQYPRPVPSMLLENVSEQGGPPSFQIVEMDALKQVGLVTDAIWVDLSGDELPELILTGEWMSFQVFENRGGKLSPAAQDARLPDSDAWLPMAEATRGWWNCLESADVDEDGDMDLIVGNLGLNNGYDASNEEPVCLHAKDYDGNGSLDPILTYFIDGEEVVAYSRDELMKQLRIVARKFPLYKAYASANFDQMFTPQEKEGTYTLEAGWMASSVLINEGGGRWRVMELPREAQYSPIRDIVATDLNNDGHIDLLLAGNDYAAAVRSGRYDAGKGLVLLGDGTGSFTPLSPSESGWRADGDARSIYVADRAGKPLYLVGQNDGILLGYE